MDGATAHLIELLKTCNPHDTDEVIKHLNAAASELQRLSDSRILASDPPDTARATDTGVFFLVNGEECCNEELALSRLLAAGVLFCNTGYFGDGEQRESTVVLFVNCNDLFAWASADAEAFTCTDIASLYRAWASDKQWGVCKWCCRQRNQRPQTPVEAAMRKAGVWDEGMEALPANVQDGVIRALFALVKGSKEAG